MVISSVRISVSLGTILTFSGLVLSFQFLYHLTIWAIYRHLAESRLQFFMMDLVDL